MVSNQDGVAPVVTALVTPSRPTPDLFHLTRHLSDLGLETVLVDRPVAISSVTLGLLNLTLCNFLIGPTTIGLLHPPVLTQPSLGGFLLGPISCSPHSSPVRLIPRNHRHMLLMSTLLSLVNLLKHSKPWLLKPTPPLAGSWIPEHPTISHPTQDYSTGMLLSRHDSSSHLYPFTAPTPTDATAFVSTAASNNWHNRLGHPGLHVLDFLRSNKFIACDKQPNTFFCNSCQVAKHKHLPFYLSTSHTLCPFDIVYCDLWTSPILSKNGYKYYLVVIDDYTHFTWVFPLKFKSETFVKLSQLHKLISTQFHFKIKNIQCDMGGEFDNLQFKNFATTHGLQFRFSCPHTSQQNGTAERMIRRLNELMMSLLTHASLPPQYWVEALHTSVYLHNILPSKAIGFRTPTAALYLKNPDYEHLQVFGCECYPNQSDTRPHKLAPRSMPCVFLGYPADHRGYRCLERSTGKIILSRHVTFNEHVFPFSNTYSPTPTSYTFLESEPSPIIFGQPMTHSYHPASAHIDSSAQSQTPPSSAHSSSAHSQSTSPTAHNTHPHPAHSPQQTTSAQHSTHNSHPHSTAQTNQPPLAQSSVPHQPSGQPLFTYSRRPPRIPAQQHPADPMTPPVSGPSEPQPSGSTRHPMITRSRDGTSKPKVPFNLNVDTISPIPKSHLHAMSDPNWSDAMKTEYNALIENNTWDLVPRPPDAHIIRCMWLFRHKYHANGTLERYKARLVVNGKSQQVGIDCDETFSPVVKPTTIRTVLSLALSRNWPIHQLDVKNAFLHGELNETVYMFQPPGFLDDRRPKHVCRLKKSLYGLKQAPRAWYHRFASYILKCGFRTSASDSSLFVYHQGNDMAYLLLYVDDIILTASNDRLLHHFISAMSREFSMTDLGMLHHFLGIEVQHSQHGLFLTQRAYVKDILARAKMENCKPCHTPTDTNSKLSATAGELLPDGTLYRSLAGALQYLTFTRPDISYAVQQVCLFMHAPREPHFNYLKRILRYLQGTADHGLHITPSRSVQLTAYSDADWGGCPDTRRSTSGYCVFIGDNLVSWSSKRQATISRSSAEAEYRGVANATAEITWIRNLLLELHVPVRQASVIYCDNISAMYLSHNPVQHQRTKHVEIDIHFVREKCVLVPFEFYMSLQTINMLISLLKDCRVYSSIVSNPVFAFGRLLLRLRGSISGSYI
ncbi:putative RNA-directed DNA polymerase [Helianthus debilis subsp. tardiflorus]